MVGLRRVAVAFIMALLAGACMPAGGVAHGDSQSLPRPWDEIGVTYLDLPEEPDYQLPRVRLNGRGDVSITGFTEIFPISFQFIAWNPVSYVWRNGTATRLGEGHTNLNDISDRGHVVGGVWETDGGQGEPLVQFKDKTTMLPIGEASLGEALAVNRHGTVAGTVKGPDGYEAVVWHKGEMLSAPVDLGPEEMSLAVDINDRNQVLLTVGPEDELSYERLLLWQVGGDVTEIHTNDGDSDLNSWLPLLVGGGSRMNQRGQVLVATFADEATPRTYLWHDGTKTELSSPDGKPFLGTDLNEWGQVVGASMEVEGKMQPLLWHRGKMTPIEVPDAGSASAVPMVINNWGQVVLQKFLQDPEGGPGSGEVELFLWQNGQSTNLGELAEEIDTWGVLGIPPLGFIVDINDRGQIVTMGVDELSSDESATRFVMWEASPWWGYAGGS